MDYERLKSFCSTIHQEMVINEVMRTGSQRKAAKSLGLNKTTVERLISRVKTLAARQGYSPDHDMTVSVPDGFHLKGTSTLYGEDGALKLQWVKSNIDRERQAELIKEFINGLVEEIPPAEPRQAQSDYLNSDLMPSIFIGDAHIGMYAWGKETKHSDFDSDIATQQIRDAIDYLVDKAPASDKSLLAVMGDFMHANTGHNQTFSGTPLDVDTRHGRVQKRAAMCMRYCVDRMLDKFGEVVVVVVRGNHDTDSSDAVRLAVEFYYSKEPRVNVLPSFGYYHYVEYGRWLLQLSHGDKQKPESLVGGMARDMPEAWGRTTHRMACVGHFHKEYVKSLPGAKYKVFAALPPPDSWHASHGYLGDGEMEMITFRREGGIHSSHVYNIPQPRHEPDVTI